MDREPSFQPNQPPERRSAIDLIRANKARELAAAAAQQARKEQELAQQTKQEQTLAQPVKKEQEPAPTAKKPEQQPDTTAQEAQLRKDIDGIRENIRATRGVGTKDTWSSFFLQIEKKKMQVLRFAGPKPIQLELGFALKELEDIMRKALQTGKLPANYYAPARTTPATADTRPSQQPDTDKDKEPVPSVKEVVASIEANLKLQPQSIQDNWKEIKENLIKVERVQGMLWVFMKNAPLGTIDRVIVPALVQTSAFPPLWKSRAFYLSDSDGDWKAVACIRESGNDIEKGDESDPENHYVQSGKVHKDMLLILKKLPNDFTNVITGDMILPRRGGKYMSEYTFKETHFRPKNTEWKKFQEFSLSAYNDFLNAVIRRSYYKGQYNTPQESDIVGKRIESYFQHSWPKSMIPDFSSSNRKSAYEMTYGKHKIRYEEYEARSPEGDVLVFVMGRDHRNRIFIDNIYDPKLGMTDYGTPTGMFNLGYVVWKKDEKFAQWKTGILKKYKPTSKSNDVTYLMENMPIIQEYKASLVRRGEDVKVLKRFKQLVPGPVYEWLSEDGTITPRDPLVDSIDS